MQFPYVLEKNQAVQSQEASRLTAGLYVLIESPIYIQYAKGELPNILKKRKTSKL